ncbi:hypothetical protein HYV79_03220 [Candidatus Woesearchaeota archaeon]|nr:hypothetical protein [Candidatus Woesearchaeota archaeon]
MKKHIVSFTLFFAWLVLFFNSIISSSYTIMPSELDHYIPDIHFIHESYQSFQLPWWNPYTFLGHPHHAILHTPTYYPLLMLLLFINTDILLVNLLILSHIIIAFLGMYFCVFYFTKNSGASLIAAFGYVTNGLIFFLISAGWIVFLFSYAILPLIILFVVMAVRKKSYLHMIVAGVFLALQIHSGGVFFVPYALFLCVLLIFFNNKIKLKYKFVLLSLFLITGFGLSAFKILPSLEYNKLTPRSEGVKFSDFIGSDVLSLKNSFSMLIHSSQSGNWNASVGFIILIFSLLGFFDKRSWIFFICILITLLYASGSFLLFLVWKFVPIINQQFDVSRALIIYMVSMCILAGFGVSRFIKKYYVCFLIALVMIALYKPVFNALNYQDMLDKNEAYYFLQEQHGLFRVYDSEERGIDTTISHQSALFNLHSLFGFVGRRFYELDTYKIFLSQIKKHDQLGELMNVKYVLSDKDYSHSNLHVLVKQFSKPYEERYYRKYLYQLNNSKPRFFLGNGLLLDKSKQEFQIQKPLPEDLIILENVSEKDIPYLELKNKNNSVAVILYKNNKIILNISSIGTLYFSERFSKFTKDWSAKLNNKVKKIYSANQVFSAVVIDEPGILIFTYAPKKAYFGFFISFLTIIMILFIMHRNIFIQQK